MNGCDEPYFACVLSSKNFLKNTYLTSFKNLHNCLANLVYGLRLGIVCFQTGNRST